MAKADTVYSLFGMKSPQQVAREQMLSSQKLLQSQTDPYARLGTALGMGLGRMFGGANTELDKARQLEAIQREYQPGNIQNMAETYTKLKQAGAPAETLNRLSADITTASAKFNERVQKQRAQSAAVEYVSRVDPKLAELVAANPDAAPKAIETVNKRLDTKVVGDSLLRLNPETNKFEAVYTKPSQPGDSFKILTPQEKKDRGLPENVPMQINLKTNKVSAMANIPRQSDATAPTGYRYVYGVNEQGEPVILKAEVIPGTPQADQLKAEKERTAKGIASTTGIYTAVADNIKDALELVRDPKSWVGGKIGRGVEVAGEFSLGILSAGSQQQLLAQKYDTIKANTAFNKLQQIRESNKTGGGLGNVSNFEVGRLEAVFGKMDATASKETQEEVLLEVQEQFTRTARAIANDYTNEELAAYGLTPDEVVMFASFRTHTKNDDGTFTPLPTSEQAQPFSLDNLPQDVRDAWDFMPDEDKRLFGWTPQ